MDSGDRRELQRACNRFTEKCLHNVAPLIVDGEDGPATRKRIRQVKYWLGYRLPFGSRVDDRLLRQLRHPHTRKHSSARELVKGHARRIKARRLQRRHERRARRTTGVGHFDGRPIANWMIPYVEWARRNGWQGRVVSGWRDPAYSESLCRNMCGAPSCPGRCAGRSSGHSQSVKPRGCIDVSDYVRFRELMRRCPLSPKLINDLPIDRVHFSTSGH